jgi:hypothetical protein
MYILVEIALTTCLGILFYKSLKFSLIKRSNPASGKKHLILFLNPKKNYSREEIIHIGKLAIFDPVTQSNFNLKKIS